PLHAEIDPAWVDEQNRYAGVGLRARVIVVNTNAPIPGEIDGLEDLNHAALRGKIVMAQPKFGTTGGHMATLFETLGEEKARALITTWAENGMTRVGSNSDVVEYVASGQMLAGLTDNDDVSHARNQDKPVAWIVPDQGEGEPGTLLIPTTVAM